MLELAEMKGGQSETEDRTGQGREKNHGSNPGIKGLLRLVVGQILVRVFICSLHLLILSLLY